MILALIESLSMCSIQYQLLHNRMFTILITSFVQINVLSFDCNVEMLVILHCIRSNLQLTIINPKTPKSMQRTTEQRVTFILFCTSKPTTDNSHTYFDGCCCLFLASVLYITQLNRIIIHFSFSFSSSESLKTVLNGLHEQPITTLLTQIQVQTQQLVV